MCWLLKVLIFANGFWFPFYGDTAVVSCTFMLTRAAEDGSLTHRTHNESRVLVKGQEGWKVVHVHV